MQQIVLFFLLITFTFVLQSQTQRHAWLLNGDAVFFSTLDQKNNHNFGIAPTAGYFFTDQLMMGTTLSYTFSKFGEDAHATSFVLTPFVRYYFTPTDRQLIWFATAGFTSNSSKIDFGRLEEKSSDESFFGGIGLDYFLNTNTAIESNLQLEQNFNETSDVSSLLYNASLRCFLPPTRKENAGSTSTTHGARLIGLSTDAGWRNIGITDDCFFSTNARLGFFITDCWVLGSDLFLGFANENALFEPQPFARYYFGKSVPIFQPFALAQFGTRFQFADKASESSFFNLNTMGGVGLDFFVTPAVALEGILAYNIRQLEDQATKQQFLNFQMGLQFFLSRAEKP